MANEKLWIAAVDGRARPKPADVRREGPDRAARGAEGPGPEEGLRLISAFSRIEDPVRRAELIEQAERYLKPGA